MTTIDVDPHSPFVEDFEATAVVEADSLEQVYSELGSHWKPDYSMYQRPAEGLDCMSRKFRDVAELLKRESKLSEEDIERDLEVSLQTVNRFYEEWTSDKSLGNGSFAFMVPTRAERENGFAPEFSPFFPLVDHIGPTIGQLMLVGTPPFIVDRYARGNDGGGEQGAMLFAPIFGDMMKDIEDPMELIDTFTNAIEDAMKFARDRLGVTSVGLGAILPGVTNFGRSINVEGVTTTTGHGGTIHLINETLKEAIRQGVTEADISKIAVVGLGAIGASIASVMSAEYPDAKLVLCDTEPEKVARTLNALELKEGRYEVTDSALSVLAMQDCKVVLCAITEGVSINRKLFSQPGKIDRIIVDDSQPTAINPVEAMDNAAAHVVWPIGESADPRLHRLNFNYGDLGPINTGVWGCEAEAFCAWKEPELAIRRPVNPELANRIGDAAKRLGIGAASLQCYGRYVEV